MRNYTLVLIFLLLFGIVLSGQSDYLELNGEVAIYPKNKERLSRFFSGYEIYEISLPEAKLTSLSESDKVKFDLNLSEKFTYDLYPSKLIPSGYETIINGVPAKNNSRIAAKSYYGFKNSEVISMTLAPNFIYGYIKTDNEQVYNIEPLRYYVKDAKHNLFILYRDSDVVDTKARCGHVGDDSSSKEENHVEPKMVTNCETIQLAIANDYGMYARYGSVEEVQNHNQGVMNNVQVNYIDEFNANIEFIIAAQFIPTSSAQDPFSSSTSAYTLLDELEVWSSGSPWNANYDMFQIWTSRDVSGSVVGLANRPGWHHLLEDFSSGAALRVLTAHEIGHNLSAQHDASGGFIMSSSVNITNAWSSSSKNSVNNRVISVGGSLANCNLNSAPTALINASNVITCIGNIVRLEDKSIYGTSRTWSTTGGSLSSTSAQNPSFSAANPGEYTITLNSTNAFGSNSEQIQINYQSNSGNVCTPSSQIFGNGGCAAFGLYRNGSVVFSNNSSLALESSNYENFSCLISEQLLSNTTYTVSFAGVSSIFQRFKLYIDYNGDGDFSDTGENVANSNYSWSGSGSITSNLDSGLSFTTPTNPLTGTYLRMRVIVDSSTPSNPCYSPSTGQIEDYGVYFGSPPSFQGCTNPEAKNYDVSALMDDGSCAFDCANTTSIISSTNANDDIITSSSVLRTSGTVNVNSGSFYWRAGQSIEFNANFSVNAGAELSVEIGGCQN